MSEMSEEEASSRVSDPPPLKDPATRESLTHLFTNAKRTKVPVHYMGTGIGRILYKVKN